MNDMENLYSEYTRLREEIAGRNINEVGAFELRNYRRRLENLHRRNLQLQNDTRTSNADIDELRQVLNLGDRMWKEVGDTLIPLIEVIDVKMALAKQMAEERRHTKELAETNLNTLRTLTSQYRRFKKTVDDINDPNLKNILEERLRIDEETIAKLEELNSKYDERIKELGDKLRIIANGGMLSELAETLGETTGLEEEEVQKETEKMMQEAEDTLKEPEEDLAEREENEYANRVAEDEHDGIPGVEVEGLDEITPLEDEPTRTITAEEEPFPELDGEDTPTSTTDTLTDGDAFPKLDGEDTPATTTDTLTEGDAFPELDGEDSPASTTDTLTEGDAFPELDGEHEPTPLTDDSTHDVEEAPTESEEETPVRATVRQPKSKLWNKIQKVLEGAKVFLLTAIAIHTGLMVGGMKEKVESNNNTDIVEETETQTETETENENETENETETLAETPAAPVETPAAPVPAPAPVEPTPTPTPTPTNTPAVTVTKNDVVLGPGESVYDSETGIEVGYTGVAAKQTSNGVESQKDRELEHVTTNTVVVRPEALKPDPTPTVLPRTGQEISEEEARKNMTEQEQKNLDEAIGDVDWDAFFNDGPTL